MTSLFDVIAADGSDSRKAARKAIVVASTRYQQSLGSFVDGSRDKGEFDARLDLVSDDLETLVRSACSEVGHDDPEGVAKSIVMTAAQRFAEKHDKDDEDDDEDDGDKATADTHSSKELLKLQNEAGARGDTTERNRLDSERVKAEDKELKSTKPLFGSGKGDKDEATIFEDGQWPQDAEKEDDKDKDDEEDPAGHKSSAVSTDESFETPSPKMDKKKWTPGNLEAIPKDNPKGPHPTTEMDVTDMSRSHGVVDNPLKDIGESVTKRVNVGDQKSVQKAPHTKAFPKGNQENPVTSASRWDEHGLPEGYEDRARAWHRNNDWSDVEDPGEFDYAQPEALQRSLHQNYDGGVGGFLQDEGHPEYHPDRYQRFHQDDVDPQTEGAPYQSSAQDPSRNPVKDLMDSDFDGFLPKSEVHQAIASYRS